MAKVLIATGGTGGHIYPAIVIGKFLIENGVNVVFTGRKNSMESDLLTGEGLKIIHINAGKFKGISFIKKVRTILRLVSLIFQSFRILKREKPDFVIGTGGYVAAPVVITAAILKIRCSICEQNALMGFGNRCLSFVVNHIFLSFRNTLKVPLRYKAIVTGNFIRKGFSGNKERKKGILIFGGSQGAKKINELFCSTLDKLALIDNVKIFHITGRHGYEFVKTEYEKFNNALEYEIYPYFDNMDKIFENVELVIARAGATSIAEIYYTKKKAILIPYPFAADNHQWHNAVEFVKTGLGVVLKESVIDSEKLFNWIKFFLSEKKRFESDYELLGNPLNGLQKILTFAKLKTEH